MSPAAVRSYSTNHKRLRGSPEVRTIIEKDTETAQYVVWDPETKDGVIIDSVLNYNPVTSKITHHSAEELLRFVKEHGIKVVKIIETHAHADHLTAAQYLKAKLGGHVPVCVGEKISEVQASFAPMFQMEDSVSPKDFDHLFQVTQTPVALTRRVLLNSSVKPFVARMATRYSRVTLSSCPMSVQHVATSPTGQLVFSIRTAAPQTRGSLDSFARLFMTKHAFETTIADQLAHNKHINGTTSLEDFVSWREGRDETLNPPRLILPSLQVNIRAGKLPEISPGKVMLKIPVSVVNDNA
ncbi:hypothetical protein HDU93_002540 [Gonapodya sp. JEL0774]|nr:hypothetical protein HDU93_002540 [Gonapodya sp. JEL0774]